VVCAGQAVPIDVTEGKPVDVRFEVDVNAQTAHRVADRLSFGPVIERTIYDYKSGKDWLLNLETGETFSLPPGLDWDRNASAVWEWAHQHGVHVMGLPVVSRHWHTGDPVPVIQTLEHGYGLPVASQRAIYGFEMKAAIAQGTNLTFETITPQQISTTLQVEESPQGRNYYKGPWLLQLAGMAWHGDTWHGTDDYLYVFQTWDDGQSGVLQITGVTENPSAVKIRYKLVQATTESVEDSGQTVAGLPPVVVETQPVSGVSDVEPGVAEIRVRFSKEMTDGSWSWGTAWENSSPDIVGKPRYESDHRTCVITVKLEPGRTYGFWINSERFQDFTDKGGRPAVPYLLEFRTKEQ
jgi:RNA polymerase sigma-70 factor (ECF subfamily)